MAQKVYYIEGYHESFRAAAPPIPDGWRVWNSTRPLVGHITWESPGGLRGWFFAAIDPEGEEAVGKNIKNEQLDGWECFELTWQEIEQQVKDYAAEHYPNRTFTFEQYGQQQIVELWFNLHEREEDDA